MTQQSAALDGTAISLSGLCILHCLALPILAASLPLAGALSEMEVIHQAFVLMALPISGFAIWRALSGRRRLWFAAMASGGLLLLLLGAFVEAFHDHEVLLTVLGALVLTAAHALRWMAPRGHAP